MFKYNDDLNHRPDIFDDYYEPVSDCELSDTDSVDDLGDTDEM
jgi:hypothetical protein